MQSWPMWTRRGLSARKVFVLLAAAAVLGGCANPFSNAPTRDFERLDCLVVKPGAAEGARMIIDCD
jgi:ABC-type uncharacterized transport system auxiliary subunit